MAEFGSSGAKYNTIFRKIRGLCLIIWHDKMLKKSLTCPNGFGLKLAKLGLKIPLKNKVKQKPRKYFGKYNQSYCNVLVA